MADGGSDATMRLMKTFRASSSVIRGVPVPLVVGSMRCPKPKRVVVARRCFIDAPTRTSRLPAQTTRPRGRRIRGISVNTVGARSFTRGIEPLAAVQDPPPRTRTLLSNIRVKASRRLEVAGSQAVAGQKVPHLSDSNLSHKLPSIHGNLRSTITSLGGTARD